MMRRYMLQCLFLFFNLFSAFLQAHMEGIAASDPRDRLEIIAEFLPENPIILEAGAHFGTDTLRFVMRWPKSEIFSFEASPMNFEKFIQNTQGIAQIHGFNLALNDANGTALLYVCDENPGASSLLAPSHWTEEIFKGPKIEVPCIILDDWCKRYALDHIDFMWLDLEGLELQVLQSSPKILGTVKVIYIETNFQEFRTGMTQYAALKAFLERQGFQLIAHWYIKGLQGDAIFVRRYRE